MLSPFADTVKLHVVARSLPLHHFMEHTWRKNNKRSKRTSLKNMADASRIRFLEIFSVQSQPNGLRLNAKENKNHTS